MLLYHSLGEAEVSTYCTCAAELGRVLFGMDGAEGGMNSSDGLIGVIFV